MVPELPRPLMAMALIEGTSIYNKMSLGISMQTSWWGVAKSSGNFLLTPILVETLGEHSSKEMNKTPVILLCPISTPFQTAHCGTRILQMEAIVSHEAALIHSMAGLSLD